MSRTIHLTLHDLLLFEETCPGLMMDIDTAIWQARLIEEQMKANNG